MCFVMVNLVQLACLLVVQQGPPPLPVVRILTMILAAATTTLGEMSSAHLCHTMVGAVRTRPYREDAF